MKQTDAHWHGDVDGNGCRPNLLFSPMQAGQMATPIYFYSTAKGYLQAAYLMISNPLRLTALPNDTTIILPMHLQLGFAAELYLKAYLMEKAHSENELRGRNLGHDLRALLALAKDHGFNLTEADYLVDLLHEGHKSFSYRYMQEGSGTYTVSPPVQAFRAFSLLDYTVDTAIGASASKNLEPQRDGWNVELPFAYWRLPAGPGVEVVDGPLIPPAR